MGRPASLSVGVAGRVPYVVLGVRTRDATGETGAGGDPRSSLSAADRVQGPIPGLAALASEGELG